MTPEQRQEIVQIILETLSELGASVENQEEVPTITDITDEDTTMPFIQRSSGVATGYVQISVANLANVVASKIDPAEAFPDKLDSITEAELALIFPLDDDSSDDSSE
jgi:hypothetical protein